MGSLQARPQAGLVIPAGTSPVSIAIDANAVAVCFSIPSITQKTSAGLGTAPGDDEIDDL